MAVGTLPSQYAAACLRPCSPPSSRLWQAVVVCLTTTRAKAEVAVMPTIPSEIPTATQTVTTTAITPKAFAEVPAATMAKVAATLPIPTLLNASMARESAPPRALPPPKAKAEADPHQAKATSLGRQEATRTRAKAEGMAAGVRAKAPAPAADVAAGGPARVSALLVLPPTLSPQIPPNHPLSPRLQ